MTKRPDLLIATALGAATALSRLPFATTRLWQWDSVLYARALESGFHVSAVLPEQRPHPPGYIFYVATASLLHRIGLGSNEALVIVSVIASGVATALMYLPCIRFAPRPVAALVAIAFAASPLVWLHGEVAHVYIVLACSSLALSLAFLAAWSSRSLRSRVALAVLLGLLAGFRQDLLVYFAPLWIHSLLPLDWRHRVLAGAALAAACLTWFLPSSVLSGGLGEYVGSVLRQTAAVSGTSATGTRSLETNVTLLALSIGWGLLGSGVVLIALLGARALAGSRTRETSPLRSARQRDGAGLTMFFALWLVPPVLFYLLVHIGEWGFALSIVPGLYALLAVFAGREWSRARPRGQAVLGAAFILAAASSAYLFVAGTDPVFSVRALIEHDRSTAAKTDYIRERLAGPDRILVLAGAELLVARYYLPGYDVAFSDDRAERRYDRRLARESLVVVYEPNALPLAPPVTAGSTQAAGLTITSMPAGTDLVLGGSDVDAKR